MMPASRRQNGGVLRRRNKIRADCPGSLSERLFVAGAGMKGSAGCQRENSARVGFRKAENKSGRGALLSRAGSLSFLMKQVRLCCRKYGNQNVFSIWRFSFCLE